MTCFSVFALLLALLCYTEAKPLVASSGEKPDAAVEVTLSATDVTTVTPDPTQSTTSFDYLDDSTQSTTLNNQETTSLPYDEVTETAETLTEEEDLDDDDADLSEEEKFPAYIPEWEEHADDFADSKLNDDALTEDELFWDDEDTVEDDEDFDEDEFVYPDDFEDGSTEDEETGESSGETAEYYDDDFYKDFLAGEDIDSAEENEATTPASTVTKQN